MNNKKYKEAYNYFLNFRKIIKNFLALDIEDT